MLQFSKIHHGKFGFPAFTKFLKLKTVNDFHRSSTKHDFSINQTTHANNNTSTLFTLKSCTFYLYYLLLTKHISVIFVIKREIRVCLLSTPPRIRVVTNNIEHTFYTENMYILFLLIKHICILFFVYIFLTIFYDWLKLKKTEFLRPTFRKYCCRQKRYRINIYFSKPN